MLKSAVQLMLVLFGLIAFVVWRGSRSKDSSDDLAPERSQCQALLTAGRLRPGLSISECAIQLGMGAKTDAVTTGGTVAVTGIVNPAATETFGAQTTTAAQDLSATVDDARWRVVGWRDLGQQAKSNNIFEEDATTPGRFVLVTFKVESRAQRPDDIYRHPRIRDSRGREFEPMEHQRFFLPKGNKTITGVALPPGVEKEFSAIYEVASDATGFAFEARTLAMSGEAKWIPMGNESTVGSANRGGRKPRQSADDTADHERYMEKLYQHVRGGVGDEAHQRENSEPPTPKKDRTNGPRFKLSAAEISSAYASDERSADLQYNNEVVEITGIVEAKSTGGIEDPFVVLRGTGAPVRCTLGSRWKRAAARLTIGQAVVVRCTMRGMLIGDITMNDGALVSR